MQTSLESKHVSVWCKTRPRRRSYSKGKVGWAVLKLILSVVRAADPDLRFLTQGI